ncbi:phosphonate C-P lyase system protein PhnH [Olsenella uli]|uniref:phosphonate C-P lyase system protein PhnH n=1 Tax=Olsenella uli TaxID=133926 RepID=UPI001958639A|nr:phosphonate C-P lyase system protein PhnH [Olsenella uli]MBM6815963.1 phosphonate C-P lyase system protein PhnH [Olsenella uli]
MTRDDVFERDSVLDRRAFALQAAFRALLDATARPGEAVELPRADGPCAADAAEAGLYPSTVEVADVLLDAATTFAVAGCAGEGALPARVTSRRTHALLAPLDEAPYVLLPEAVRADGAARAIAALTPGTLLDPHLGATCLVECSALVGTGRDRARVGSVSGDVPTSRWRLTGPGIKESAVVECDRADVLLARAGRADEFPCGIDLVLVSRAGHVVAIPRTTRIEEVA